jgi:hypothetical protein
MDGDEARCLTAGMDAYLSKPIEPAALFDVVEHSRSASRLAAAELPHLTRRIATSAEPEVTSEFTRTGCHITWTNDLADTSVPHGLVRCSGDRGTCRRASHFAVRIWTFAKDLLPREKDSPSVEVKFTQFIAGD